MNKKLKIALPFLFSLVMIIGMFIGYKLHFSSGGKNFFTTNKRLTMEEVLDVVKNKYVDKVEIDSLDQTAINAIIKQLDPHSLYISPNDLSKINEEIRGDYEGIGAEFKLINDTPVLMRIFDKTPSAFSGMQVGDKLIKAEDTVGLTRKGIGIDEIKKKVRGKETTPVTLHFVRDNKVQNITLIRSLITVPPVDAAYMLTKSIGYIHINKFAEKTYASFMQNLEALQKQGMQSLILDLKGNGGGLMNEAIQIADEFIADNKLIVYTEGEKSVRTNFTAKREGLFEKGKLVVLIDEHSASASEVLAGALQDWDRATLVGKRTYGKGLVQQQFSLNNGGALRLTVARYFTPLGRNIQKPYQDKKIQPHKTELEKKGSDENEKIENRDYLNKKIYTTAKGKKLYDGGGIAPDIHIGYDSLKLSTAQLNILLKNQLLNSFIVDYYLKNLPIFNTINSLDALSDKFNNPNKIWLLFKQFAAQQQIILSGFGQIAQQQTTYLILARWASIKFGLQGYYQMYNKTDAAVLKAIEIIDNGQ